ncbi:MAG TPA: hypothetical protein VIX91_20775 [Candidatus Acidoferrum sp.]
MGQLPISALVEIKTLEDGFLSLPHEGHTTCGLRERAETISKRVGLVIPLSHLVPPVMDLRETVMGGRDWTSAPLYG